METSQNQLFERFFNCLISGDRPGARMVVDQVLDAAACDGQKVLTHLYWPTLERFQKLYRNDQMSNLAYNYATRLLRHLIDQMQLRLKQSERRNTKVLVVSGSDQSEELSAQIASDLLEADGYDVFYAGGGIANDEIIEQIGELNADRLVIFGAVPSMVPHTRQLIDRLHEIGVCPHLQIIVGGGVFNRADGLAEEIGADLWAKDPTELVGVMNEQQERRMAANQRTVGRRRRNTRRNAA